MHIYYLTKISIRRCISKKHLCKILLCKKMLEISVITHLLTLTYLYVDSIFNCISVIRASFYREIIVLSLILQQTRDLYKASDIEGQFRKPTIV